MRKWFTRKKLLIVFLSIIFALAGFTTWQYYTPPAGISVKGTSHQSIAVIGLITAVISLITAILTLLSILVNFKKK